MNNEVALVLMVGGGACSTQIELTLRQARQAAARDILKQATSIARISPLIVVSDDADWLYSLDGTKFTLEFTLPGEPFHFGQTLAEMITRYRLQNCFYIGGGSAPLLSTASFAQIAEAVLVNRPVMVTNNLHSSDWAAFAPADVVPPLAQWLERDNALAWIWQEKTGYPVQVLPRSTATQMDIDTPFDLLALARHPATQPHLGTLLGQLKWPDSHLDATVNVLRREASHIIIAGRVSSWVWSLLERNTRVWIRVFAEERGMRASGRQARGEVQSLLSDYLDLVGVENLFIRLARLADAILLDSRVILASRNMWPSDADRFHSDLLMDTDVNEPFLRKLTAAARSAPVPVVLGGHSLVSGGLAVLLEGAGLA